MVQVARIALTPLWALQLLSAAKSFKSNGLIGSRTLNRLGLHVARKVLAHGCTATRRFLLSGLVPAEVRRDFSRDGFVVIDDFLPAEDFQALCSEARSLSGEGARRIQEGDTVTRLALLDDAALARSPQLSRLVRGGRFLGLCNYIGARLKHPLCQVQVLARDFATTQPDPQKSLHADTFHPTLKGWLFLEDVDAARGPLQYVAGSHRLTPRRLAWEYRQSLEASASPDAHVAAGSFRIEPGQLAALGLPQPTPMLVRANTLVLADTAGFHRRGEAQDDRERSAIYIFMRTNPFNPILGFRSRAWRRLELMFVRRLGQTAKPAPAEPALRPG